MVSERKRNATPLAATATAAVVLYFLTFIILYWISVVVALLELCNMLNVWNAGLHPNNLNVRMLAHPMHMNYKYRRNGVFSVPRNRQIGSSQRQGEIRQFAFSLSAEELTLSRHSIVCIHTKNIFQISV